MAAILLRLTLLALGVGFVEIGLGGALVDGSPASWGLALVVGLPLIIAGSAWFMGPLLGGPAQKGTLHR